MKQAITVSLYNGVTDVNGVKVLLEDLVNSMKQGTYKKEIESVRLAKKEDRGKLKCKLPAFTPSGVFEKRNKTGLAVFTGILQLDIDYKENKQLIDRNGLETILSQVKKDSYTMFSAVSPSGNGIKVLVRIPQDISKHGAAWKSLSKYYKARFKLVIDSQTKDISRLMFVTHDPNLFYNSNSKMFTKYANSAKTAVALRKQGFGANENIYDDIINLVNKASYQKIDITHGYENWRNIGFALAETLGQQGRTSFHRLSEISPQYDYDTCDRQFDKCLQSGGKGITHKTLFKIAMDNGVYLNSGVIFKNGNTVLKRNDKEKYNSNVEILSDNPYPKEDVEKNSFYQQGDFYYASNRNKRQLTNFTGKVLYHFPDGTNNSSRLIAITNSQNGTQVFEVTAKDLTLQSFKSTLRSMGNFTFLGRQSDLDQIMMAWCTKESEANKLDSLGYNKDHDVFVFSNGVITSDGTFKITNEYGVVELAKGCIYIPASSEINMENNHFDSQRNFRFDQGSGIDFQSWSKLLMSAYGENGMVGSAFLVSALFRDLVFTQTGHYPFLFLFGAAGGGKTSFANFLLSPFVQASEKWGISTTSTDKAIGRKLTIAVNSISYLKEFNQGISDRTIEFLKNAYDGVGYDRAQKSNDNATHQTIVGSAILLDGNFLPVQQSALMDRLLILQFDKRNHTPKTAMAEAELRIMNQKGIGEMIQEVFKLRGVVKNRLVKTFEGVKRDIIDATEGLSSRSVNNLASFASPIICILKEVNAPFIKAELLQVLIKLALVNSEILENIDEVNEFWKSVATSITESGSDSYIVAKGIVLRKDEIGINLNKYFEHYIDYCKKNNIKSPLDKETLRQLLLASVYKIEKSKPITEGGQTIRYDVFQKKVVDEIL